VVAPALIPQNPGERVKTDRRDAGPWARLARAGDLTAGYVPPVAEEAMRDLTRAREAAISALTDAKWRRTAFLRRHDIRYIGRAHWGPAPLRGRSEGVCPTPVQPIVLQDDVRAVREHSARLQRLAQERPAHVKAWRWSPVGEALHARRGVHCPGAVTLGADRGDLPRFERPRALRKCLGLLPSAYSSGAHRRQGSMPTAGHTHARRVLVAGAWAYRDPAKGRRPLPLRLEHPPTVLQAIRGKAQVRLCTRSRRLVARGKHAHGGPGAMARALTGCMWALAKAGPIVASDAGGL
jgi:transposase